MRNSIFFILSFSVLLSCNNSNSTASKEEAVSTSHFYYKDFDDDDKMKSLKSKIIISGDTLAYNTLEKIYILTEHRNELLYFALVMAENFNYPKAYYGAYLALETDINNQNKSNKLANYYLLKSHEKGYVNAKYDIKERFKDAAIPTAADYWDEIN